MPRSSKPPPAQLGLFGAAATPAPAPPLVETVDDPEAKDLAARLPDFIRLGTSSWTFPGWAGLVYAGRPTQAQLVRAGLAAYARHPLLRTVGIDRSFYAPIPRPELEAYARQVPPGFRAVAKMWEEVTTFAWPAHPRYGARGGTKNEGFLDAARARDVIAAYTECFKMYTACILFEITPQQPGSIVPDDFARHLDGHARCVKTLDAANSTHSLLGTRPEDFPADPVRTDASDAGYYDATLHRGLMVPFRIGVSIG